MTTRILPPDEWHRLPAECEIPAALPYHDPADVQIVVVERGGEIVATWAVLRVVQLEGVWIAPAYRGRGAVARRLLDATMAVARRAARCFAFTGATNATVARLLEAHLSAKPLPMQPYVIPLRTM